MLSSLFPHTMTWFLCVQWPHGPSLSSTYYSHPISRPQFSRKTSENKSKFQNMKRTSYTYESCLKILSNHTLIRVSNLPSLKMRLKGCKVKNHPSSTHPSVHPSIHPPIHTSIHPTIYAPEFTWQLLVNKHFPFTKS